MAELVKRSRGESCISDLRFDRLLEDELDAASRTAIDAHLLECALCRERRRELVAARERFDAGANPQLAQLEARAAARKRTRARAIPTGLVAAAALAASVWFALLPPPGDPEPTSRLKGDHRFGFYVQRSGAVRRGAAGERLMPGDRVRFVVRTSAPTYFAVLSLDGARRASIYHPAAARAAQIGAGPEQALQWSVKLDGVLGPERWYALFCTEPIALEPVRAALERSGPDFSAPPGCAVESVLVQKVAAQ